MTRGYQNEETSREQVSLRLTCLDWAAPSLFSCCFRATTKPNYEERLPHGKHTMQKHRCPNANCRYKTGDVKDELAVLYFSWSTQMAQKCKPPVNPLHKHQLRLRKCRDRLYHLQDLIKSGLTSLPAGKITPQQQNSKAKTWSYNCSNVVRNGGSKIPQKEHRRFPHQQIHEQGNGSN